MAKVRWYEETEGMWCEENTKKWCEDCDEEWCDDQYEKWCEDCDEEWCNDQYEKWCEEIESVCDPDIDEADIDFDDFPYWTEEAEPQSDTNKN